MPLRPHRFFFIVKVVPELMCQTFVVHRPLYFFSVFVFLRRRASGGIKIAEVFGRATLFVRLRSLIWIASDGSDHFGVVVYSARLTRTLLWVRVAANGSNYSGVKVVFGWSVRLFSHQQRIPIFRRLSPLRSHIFLLFIPGQKPHVPIFIDPAIFIAFIFLQDRREVFLHVNFFAYCDPIVKVQVCLVQTEFLFRLNLRL